MLAFGKDIAKVDKEQMSKCHCEIRIRIIKITV